MRVRILLPSLRWPVGAIVEMSDADGEALIRNGFAAAAIEDDAPRPALVDKGKAKAARTKGGDRDHAR